MEDNEMAKKKIIIISIIFVAIIAAIVTIPLIKVALQKPVIGTIKGPEHDFIEIDGVRYAQNSDNDFSGADRGEYLGSVTDGNITMRVFSVKGDDSGRYIYALWDWDGAFYVREN